MRKKGGGSLVGAQKGKRGKVERGANLMEGGTHSELMHSNIFAMKPMD